MKPKVTCRERTRKPKRTVGEMLRHPSDDERARAWLLVPPSLPESDNPLDIGFPTVAILGQSLPELVIKWKVSADEAERAFRSWAAAEKQVRKLSLTGKRMPRQTAELISQLKGDFWGFYRKEPVAQCLRELANDIEALENAGHAISLDCVATILSKPLPTPRRSFLEWLVRHWILPDGDIPPLCLCSDGLIDAIVEKQGKMNADNGIAPVGESVRQAAHELGLFRPTKPRLRKAWLEQAKA